MGRARVQRAVDIDAAPHILVCTGTGGSTTILRTLTAQLLHQGVHALVSTPPASPTCGRKTCRRSRTAATSPASTTPGRGGSQSRSQPLAENIITEYHKGEPDPTKVLIAPVGRASRA